MSEEAQHQKGFQKGSGTIPMDAASFSTRFLWFAVTERELHVLDAWN